MKSSISDLEGGLATDLEDEAMFSGSASCCLRFFFFSSLGVGGASSLLSLDVFDFFLPFFDFFFDSSGYMGPGQAAGQSDRIWSIPVPSAAGLISASVGADSASCLRFFLSFFLSPASSSRLRFFSFCSLADEVSSVGNDQHRCSNDSDSYHTGILDNLVYCVG